MAINESIEYFPLFDPETEADPPRVTAAVGSRIAALGTPDALGGSGAVVIYMYSEARNGWGYVGMLAGSKIAGSEQVRAVGSSLAAFGDTLLVGASGDPATPGRVFVLSPPYGAWTYTALPVVAELTYPKATKGDFFGAAVAHCSDGTDDYIAVGAPGAAPPIGVSGPGQVFVFKGLKASGTPWSTSPIANPNPAGAGTDRFGASVAISMSGDGTVTIAAGAPGGGDGQGAVYAGRTTEAGTWTSPFKFGEPLQPSFPDAEDFQTKNFGTSLALTGGALLAVGAPNDPNFADQIEDTGAVWIYEYSDAGFVPADYRLYGPTAGGNFGHSVAFPEAAPGAKAAYMVVGGPGAGSGDAYRFADAGDGFKSDKQFASLPGKPGNRFGTAVAASDFQHGSWCLVGAPGAPKAGQEGGGFVYVEGDPMPAWMETPALISTPPLRWGGVAPDWWKKFTPEIPRYL
jgi:hypothetical protein